MLKEELVLIDCFEDSGREGEGLKGNIMKGSGRMASRFEEGE